MSPLGLRRAHLKVQRPIQQSIAPFFFTSLMVLYVQARCWRTARNDHREHPPHFPTTTPVLKRVHTVILGRAVLHRCRVHARNLTQLCQHTNFETSALEVLTMLAAILDRTRVQISMLFCSKVPTAKATAGQAPYCFKHPNKFFRRFLRFSIHRSLHFNAKTKSRFSSRSLCSPESNSK